MKPKKDSKKKPTVKEPHIPEGEGLCCGRVTRKGRCVVCGDKL